MDLDNDIILFIKRIRTANELFNIKKITGCRCPCSPNRYKPGWAHLQVQY